MSPNSLLQSKFSRECNLVLPLSASSTCWFSSSHPRTADVLFLVFPSLLSLLLHHQSKISNGVHLTQYTDFINASFTFRRHCFTVNEQIQFHLFSTELFVDLLYHIPSKSNNKCSKDKQKFMQIFTKLIIIPQQHNNGTVTCFATTI